MSLVDATVNVRDSAGTLVFDLSTGGYGIGPVSDDGFTWLHIRARSPFVDGWTLVHATQDGGILSSTLVIAGSTWVEVEQRRLALIPAITPLFWKLELVVEGVSITYRAEPTDMQPEKLTAPVIANCARQFALSVPVQPHPVVTGV